ncbi:vacuolar sorting-associated 35B-like isoform X1, partial [Olea europaea subsp. europaea]
MLISNGIEDEDKWPAKGIARIQHIAFYLHRALDSNNLREELKYSAQLLSELRTSRLMPHKGMCRWLDHIPMSPIEGSLTIFQVIYNLTPGYHQ